MDEEEGNPKGLPFFVRTREVFLVSGLRRDSGEPSKDRKAGGNLTEDANTSYCM